MERSAFQASKSQEMSQSLSSVSIAVNDFLSATDAIERQLPFDFHLPENVSAYDDATLIQMTEIASPITTSHERFRGQIMAAMAPWNSETASKIKMFNEAALYMRLCLEVISEQRPTQTGAGNSDKKTEIIKHCKAYDDARSHLVKDYGAATAAMKREQDLLWAPIASLE